MCLAFWTALITSERQCRNEDDLAQHGPIRFLISHHHRNALALQFRRRIAAMQCVVNIERDCADITPITERDLEEDESGDANH